MPAGTLTFSRFFPDFFFAPFFGLSAMFEFLILRSLVTLGSCEKTALGVALHGRPRATQ